MHHEKTKIGEPLRGWKNSRPSRDGTHHITSEGPLYESRFEQVLSFHYPGLAPAKKDGKWFHIKPDGTPAYAMKYDRVLGFYEQRAAVKKGKDWFHIRPNGKKAYRDTYSWCGNYQQSLCVVRDREGKYYHIDLEGDSPYKERYHYAGDFREGYAVAWLPNGCIHIDMLGNHLNDIVFRELGVFHKGYATARDEYGWFHIDKSGLALYPERYQSVEPFYNGLALCVEHNGNTIRIDPSGELFEKITEKAAVDDGRKILLIGNLSSGKTTLGRELERILRIKLVRIDDCRRMMADGTMAGEYRAWHRFISECEAPRSTILEFSGGGPHIYNISRALENSTLDVSIIWLDLSIEKCIETSLKKSFDSPYPYEMGDLVELISHIAREIETAWLDVWLTNPGFQTLRIKDPRHHALDYTLAFLMEKG